MAHSLSLAIPPPAPYQPAWLTAVAAPSPDDAWAAAYPSKGPWQWLAHWDGTAWDWNAYVESAKTYALTSTRAFLNDVCAASATDVWAVGGVLYGTQSAYTGQVVHTFVLHYDGSTVGNDQPFFQSVFSPNATDDSNVLRGVDAISASEAWAVGESVVEHPPKRIFGLAIHWNGSDWRVTRTPDLGTVYVLRDVAITAPDDVWAVGTRDTGGAPDPRPLILHWDGTRWEPVSTPLDQTRGELNGVASVGPDDVWAVGTIAQGQALHWDGSRWHAVVLPAQPPGMQMGLTDVAGEAGDDVWAVGSRSPLVPYGVTTPYVTHWDGGTWSEVPCPNHPSSTGVPGDHTTLYGVAPVTGRVVIAGSYTTAGATSSWGEPFAVVGW